MFRGEKGSEKKRSIVPLRQIRRRPSRRWRGRRIISERDHGRMLFGVVNIIGHCQPHDSFRHLLS